MVPSASVGEPASFRLVDYHGSRQYGDMLRFALSLMPNYALRVHSLERFDELEREPGAIKLLCFLGLHPSVATPPLLRTLSATYRGRVNVLDVRVHESAPAGAAIAARYSVSALPSVMALRASGEIEPWRHKGPPTLRRLKEFASALLADAEAAAGGAQQAEKASTGSKEEL